MKNSGGRGSHGARREEVDQTDRLLYVLGLTLILELASILILGILSGDGRTDGSLLGEFLRGC